MAGIFDDSADVIVIGAGIGGLSAAAYLARAGRKVIVFEQDNHLGGTAHVFKRNGFTFPAGPMSFTAPEYISAALLDLGVNGSPGFIRDHFQVRRGSLNQLISLPLPRLAEELSNNFPGEKRGILAVIGVLEKVIAALDRMRIEEFMEEESSSPARQVIERWGNIPARDLVDRNLKDPFLRDLLGSQGTSEPEMSVVLLARMWNFMSEEGIWYTVGGINKVPELLAERVCAFGGEIRLGERVGRILVQEGRAVGVELCTGGRIISPLIISDADYKETILKLLPGVPAAEKKNVLLMPLTSSAFSVFMGVKKGYVDLSAFRGDHLLVKLEEGEPVPWEEKMPRPEDFMQDEIWLSWWSRHDPLLALPGCEALIIKVDAPFDVFAPFDAGGRRQGRYYSMKEEMADALVEASSKVLPGLPLSVVVREVATPLTYKDRGHRSNGSVAGWSWRSGDHPESWTRSLAVTRVEGLLMVGLQSFTRLFYGGMGTAMYSGKYAADIALGKPYKKS